MAVVGRWEFGAESGPSGEAAAPVFDGASSFAQVAIKPGLCGPMGAMTFSFRPAAMPGEDGQAPLLALTPGNGPTEFQVSLAAGGSVQIVAGGSICPGGLDIQTPPGFCAPGDMVELICSWDAEGGGHVEIINASELAAGGGLGHSVFGAHLPAGFSLEGAEDGSMYFGAAPGHGSADGFFHGWIGKASGCDTPLPPVHPAAMPDGIVDGTAGNDVIDADYLG
ncbi:MAG: hypothetical protein KJN93_09735, partial [Alphaproteobacteria bacterium]|nr:hypothetical protein [Alphaproteobacteria bacterium]